MTDYTIRKVDGTRGTIEVEYEDRSRMVLSLPIDPDGNAITGENLKSYIMDFKPRTFIPVVINNIAEIQALVVPDPVQSVETWSSVRATRDMRLRECDFTMLPDSPFFPTRDDWRAYRQKLRDITDDFASPNEIVWPTPPEDLVIQ